MIIVRDTQYGVSFDIASAFMWYFENGAMINNTQYHVLFVILLTLLCGVLRTEQ